MSPDIIKPIFTLFGQISLESQKVVRTDAATHAVPAWKMSTQGKTGRKKILKIKDFMKFL